MVLTTPLIERLAQRGAVHVVATPLNAELLRNNPSVQSVILYDKRGADSGVRGIRRLASELRAIGASAAYVAQGSMRSGLMARLSQIRERIGFESSPGRVFYTRRIPFRRELHHSARLWSLASEATDSAAPPALRPTLYPGAVERESVTELLATFGVSENEKLVAVAPGSIWGTKRWPGYAKLAGEMGRSTVFRGSRVVVIGGANDRVLASAVVEATALSGGPPAVDATGRLSLLASAELIGRCALLLTNDSLPLHLASAMNTPTVAIFGPTVPEFGFGPLAERRTSLGVRDLSCRPCDDHGPVTCPLGHWKCMKELGSGVVMSAAELL